MSLWPADDTGRWLNDTGHGRMTIAGAYGPDGREFNPPTAEAQYFPAGYWMLRFSGDFRDNPLPREPDAWLVTGMGWTEDGEYINFTTTPTPAEVDPDPVRRLRQLGLINPATEKLERE